jgi:hypothetical protein
VRRIGNECLYYYVQLYLVVILPTRRNFLVFASVYPRSVVELTAVGASRRSCGTARSQRTAPETVSLEPSVVSLVKEPNY